VIKFIRSVVSLLYESCISSISGLVTFKNGGVFFAPSKSFYQSQTRSISC
jgi:hypothetical protein